MSSLRVESLRLCWLEAFIAVAEAENISEAARELGVSQPTVSRYLQALERWLGKKLVEPGRISDPDDPRVSVAITEDGRDFFKLATEWLEKLTNFRTAEARCQDELTSMGFIIGRMHADLTSESPPYAAVRRRDAIEDCWKIMASAKETTPLEALKMVHKSLMRLFSDYEVELNVERRRSRVRNRGGIDPTKLRVTAEPPS